jgi:hypothetical protein
VFFAMLRLFLALALAAVSCEVCNATDADETSLRGNMQPWLEGENILAHKRKGRGTSVCHRWDWRKKVLKLVKEVPASGAFPPHSSDAHIRHPVNTSQIIN